MQPRITFWPGSTRSEDDGIISEINYCDTLTMSLTHTIHSSDNLLCLLALKSLGTGMSGYLVVVQFCDLLMIRHKDLLSSQSFPSGKQSLPVPLSSSLPQSSGKSASLPVACGAWVPSSRNLGPPPKNLITGFKKFWMGRKKSKPPNWALACWAARASVRQVTRRQLAGILISRLSWKDWDGAVWGVTRWQVWGPASARPHCGHQPSPPQCPGLWQHCRVSWCRWSISHWTWNTQGESEGGRNWLFHKFEV